MLASIDYRLFAFYEQRIIKVGAMFTIQEYEVSTDGQLLIVGPNYSRGHINSDFLLNHLFGLFKIY